MVMTKLSKYVLHKRELCASRNGFSNESVLTISFLLFCHSNDFPLGIFDAALEDLYFKTLEVLKYK